MDTMLSPRFICRTAGVCGSPAARAGVCAGTRPRAWLGGIGVLNVAVSSLAAAATDIRVERRDPRVDEVAAVSSCATADAAVDIRVDLRVLALRDVVVVADADAVDALPLLRGVGSALELEFNDDFALLLPLPVVVAVAAVSLVRFPSGFRFLLPLRRAVLGGGGGGMSIESMLSNFSRTFSSCTLDMSE